MTGSTPDLAALRREIDRIDDAMHDLLMRRTEAVLGVAAAKRDAGGPVLRPAREAEVLRRLVGRHRGRFPKPTLVRLWREIMAGHVHVQTKFSLAIYGDLARLAHDHFGTATPASHHDTVAGVLAEVRDGRANVGILPLPVEDEADPWWPILAGKERNTPSIIARLPFVPGVGGALAVAPIAQEKSGADRSYLVLETSGPVSRHGLTDTLQSAGLPPVFLASASTRHLAEIADFVPADDARLARVGAIAVGGYAVPFTAAELAP